MARDLSQLPVRQLNKHCATRKGHDSSDRRIVHDRYLCNMHSSSVKRTLGWQDTNCQIVPGKCLGGKNVWVKMSRSPCRITSLYMYQLSLVTLWLTHMCIHAHRHMGINSNLGLCQIN